MALSMRRNVLTASSDVPRDFAVTSVCTNEGPLRVKRTSGWKVFTPG